MNSANQKLQVVKNRKAFITKQYNEAKEWLENQYAEDMAILDKEEKDLLNQFNDVPIDDIYKKKHENIVKTINHRSIHRHRRRIH